MSKLIDPDREWEAFWKPLVAPHGEIDMQALKNELYDYSMLLRTVPIIYDYATGGTLSKTNTDPDAIKAAIDDHVQMLVDEAIEEYNESQDIPGEDN